MAVSCPACDHPARDALWWSKAGWTSKLCAPHLQDARERRRLIYELDKMRNGLGLPRQPRAFTQGFGR